MGREPESRLFFYGVTRSERTTPIVINAVAMGWISNGTRWLVPPTRFGLYDMGGNVWSGSRIAFITHTTARR